LQSKLNFYHMKILKIVGLSLLALIAIIAGIGFILPGKVHVERKLVMKASAQQVFDQIVELRKWEEWSPWHNIDSAMTIEYSEPSSGVGSSYSWKSTHENVGNGSMKITAAEPGKLVSTEMNFMENGTATADFILKETPEGTEVTWTMDSDLGANPFAHWMGLMIDKFVGKDYEKGLASLKEVSEAAPQLTVEIKEGVPVDYIGIKTTASEAEISQVLGTSYGKLMEYAMAAKAEVSGVPFAFYYTYDPAKMELMACLPVNKKLPSKGEIESGKLAAGQQAVVEFYGPYEKTPQAHEAIDAWMKANNHQPSGPCFEEYVTDPATEKDPNKWLTRVCYPL
jgi:effector-binding domain-containing protein